MRYINTIVIGAGQAGLTMSHCLSERQVPHVVLERGDVANSWANERWDSLRLLTPNWQSRLPGKCYEGPDAHGFMSMPEIISFLRTYAERGAMPIETRTTVRWVRPDGRGYRVATSRGDWLCDNLILANGGCAIPKVPQIAKTLPDNILQITPMSYRNPGQLPDGGVLVVGASASGVQIAAEIRAAGHAVTLAAGHHIRAPRSYRGHDIQWWMDQSGVLDQRLTDSNDLSRARAVPSLQLVGRADLPLMDLNHLQSLGIEITGRLSAIREGTALFSGGLANACELSDLKMARLLKTFDTWAETKELANLPGSETIDPTHLKTPRLSLNLINGEIQTVVWATGFRPDFSWLNMPVFDRKGRLHHDGGFVAEGLYALGLPMLRRRKSALLDGVGTDAAELADHIIHKTQRFAA